MRYLFSLLAVESNSEEDTFVIVREISNIFIREREFSRLIRFLSDRTSRYPEDPFNSFHLLKIAHAYIQKDSLPVAALYFDLIVKNHPDLIINGESIHLAALRQLINLTENAEKRVWYYEELIARFSDKIDLGAAWFMLAQAYEEVGNWSGAIRAYTNFLPFSRTPVPGFPNAAVHARQIVNFHNSAKDWTFESLPALVAAVTSALRSGNPRQLTRLQARANFTTRSWEQGALDVPSMANFNLALLWRGSRIHFADRIDPSSNANEAFLRTWGWPQAISTWYLFFRRINFPMDPYIHGRWEWAGVFHGERF